MLIDFSRSGFLYLIQQENKDLYKIGFTKNNPLKRLKQIQTGNCEKLALRSIIHSLDVRKLETLSHNFFQRQRKLNEWYSLPPSEYQSFMDQFYCKWLPNSFINNVVLFQKLLTLKLTEFGYSNILRFIITTLNLDESNEISSSIHLQEWIKGELIFTTELGNVTYTPDFTFEQSSSRLFIEILKDFNQYPVFWGNIENKKYFFILRSKEEILAYQEFLETKNLSIIFNIIDNYQPILMRHNNPRTFQLNNQTNYSTMENLFDIFDQ